MTIKAKHIISFLLGTAYIGVGLSYSSLYLFHLAAGITLLSTLFLKGTFNLPKKLKGPFLFPVFLLVFYATSILWAPNKTYAFQYVFYILMGCIIIYGTLFLLKSKKELDVVLKVLLGLFTIEMIICVLEAFTSFRYPLSPYNPLVAKFGHAFKIDTTLAIEIQNQILSVPTGFHWNPNNLAATITMVLPFLLFLKNKMLRVSLSLLAIGIIITTNSRGVLIALFLILGIYILFYFKTKIRYLVSATMFSALILLFVPNQGQKLQKIGTKINESKEALSALLFEEKEANNSIGSRQMLIQNGLENLHENFYLGIGGGNSKYIQESKGKVNGKLTSMHNFWVEILVEAGLLVFILFMVWYFLLILQLLRIANKKEELRYCANSCALSLIGLLIGAISCSSIIYLLPFWILIALSLFTIRLAFNPSLIVNKQL